MQAPSGPRAHVTQPTPHAAHTPLRPGETVLHGRFALGAPIVDEAPGAYFSAHDTLTNTEVTLRVLLLHGAVETGGLVRLRHDLRRTAASPHPYILRVLDCDVTAQMLLLATEPRGKSLRQVLATRRLTVPQALTYALHIAGALGFIHTHGVAHGRLTPATVDIHGDSARLTDIGLGQIATAFVDPWPGDMASRQSYLPPEERYEAFPTPATDVYHFGALLWEMLAGAPPPLAPAPLPPLDAPLALAQCIAHCLHPTAAERPHTMSEIIATLKALKRGLDGKGPNDSLIAAERRADAASLATMRVEVPTVLMPRQTAPVPTVDLAFAPESSPDPRPTAALPSLPPTPTRRLPRLRLGQRSLGTKLLLTVGVLGSLIAGFALANGSLRSISHAAPPPADAVVLRAGVTVLAPRTGPYRVTQTLVLGLGRTLRLVPGTTLTFAPGSALIVAGGTLEAHGTVASPVTFTTADNVATGGGGAPWDGIQINAAADGTPSRVVLDGVVLRAAGNGTSAAIICHAGVLTLINSTQSDSPGTGVLTDANCWGEVAHTTFARDLGPAANIGSASMHFHDNTFTGLTVSLP